MQIRRVAGALGAEIIGVDLRDPKLDFEAVYQAFLEHKVVFFRGAHLTSEEHLALGRRFGTPSIYPVARIRSSSSTMSPGSAGPRATWFSTSCASTSPMCPCIAVGSGRPAIWPYGTSAPRCTEPLPTTSPSDASSAG